MDNLTQIEWIACYRKIRAKNELGWITKTQVTNKMKTLWKNVFYNSKPKELTAKGTELFNVIWNNTNLRNSLLDLSRTATKTPIQQFNDIFQILQILFIILLKLSK